ncbi:hypothetical protein ES703_77374 [subsurface metagenome]
MQFLTNPSHSFYHLLLDGQMDILFPVKGEPSSFYILLDGLKGLDDLPGFPRGDDSTLCQHLNVGYTSHDIIFIKLPIQGDGRGKFFG